MPEQGTVGASGDLAPLSHLALGLMGEGQMWSPATGWGDAKYVLESHNLTPICLEAKEGLALINGTQLITSIGDLTATIIINITVITNIIIQNNVTFMVMRIHRG